MHVPKSICLPNTFANIKFLGEGNEVRFSRNQDNIRVSGNTLCAMNGAPIQLAMVLLPESDIEDVSQLYHLSRY